MNGIVSQKACDIMLYTENMMLVCVAERRIPWEVQPRAAHFDLPNIMIHREVRLRNLLHRCCACRYTMKPAQEGGLCPAFISHPLASDERLSLDVNGV